MPKDNHHQSDTFDCHCGTKHNDTGFHILLDAICDPVFVTDLDGRCINLNEAACRMLGYNRQELLSIAPAELSIPGCAGIVALKLEMVKKQGPQTFEYTMLCKNGRTIDVELTSGLATCKGNEVIVTTARDITDRKKAASKLAHRKEYFEALFRSSSDAIISLDHNHLTVDINPRFEELFGYTLGDLAGRNIDDFIYPQENPEECRVISNDVMKGQSITKECLRRRKDGSNIHVLVRGTPIIMENKIAGVLGIYSDITERITADRKLTAAHKLQQDIIDFLPDPTFVVNRDGKVIAWNRAMEKMSGVKKEAIVGQGDNAYSVPFYGDRRPVLLDYFLSEDQELINIYQNFKKTDHKIFAQTFAPLAYQGRGAYLWITASPLFDRDGHLTGAIESIRDISEQKEREQRLEFLSWHDQLTGMYNRTFFEHKIENMDLIENLPVTIITCDVDGLKLVNDTMGHTAGDKLLQNAAAVIKESTRSSDMAARIGGDEFAILLTRTDYMTGARVCRRIKKTIEKHNLTNNLPLSISIGMASAGGTDTDINELFKEADNKMYREKLLNSKSARSNVVQALMSALEARDFITEGHCNRIADLATGLGKVICLPDDRLAGLKLLARFHDIGKVGVPDMILFKPDMLTNDEMSLMRMHCEIGHRIAMTAADLVPIAELILKHHEWWNGQGYPLKLNRLDIPLECRIIAIVDAYDAMTNDRPYRNALSEQQAIDELLKCAGTQFDPHLVAKFLRML